MNRQPELVLAGSGTTNPSRMLWKLFERIEEQSRRPLWMSYRAVGSSTGQKEYVGENNDGVAFNHFGSGDIPLTQDRYDALRASGRTPVHIPFLLGAISFFHNVPNLPAAGLQVTGCILARIFSRDITTWDHPDILALNPGMTVPNGQGITVVHRTLGSSSTASITEYLHTRCPEHWPLELVSSAQSSKPVC